MERGGLRFLGFDGVAMLEDAFTEWGHRRLYQTGTIGTGRSRVGRHGRLTTGAWEAGYKPASPRVSAGLTLGPLLGLSRSGEAVLLAFLLSCIAGEKT